MRECTYPECGRPLNSKGLCYTHYHQRRRGEELRPIADLGGSRQRRARKPCSFAGCESHATAKGLCPGHRKQELRGEPLRPVRNGRLPAKCLEQSCDRPATTLGYCDSHYAQFRRRGEVQPLHVPTYRYVDSNGYVRLKEPDHPNAGKNGLVGEHIKVMSEHVGRPLYPDETVHHKNGNREDNRLSNLELWSSRHPKGQRVEDKVEFAIEMLRRYAPERLMIE